MNQVIKDTIIMRVIFGFNAFWVTYVFTGDTKTMTKLALTLITINTICFYVWQRFFKK